MIISNWQNIQNVKDLASLVRYTSMDLQQILNILNGNIGLTDNCSTDVISVSFPKANTTYSFAHNLGRIPAGFINIGMNFSSAVFNGNQNNTINQIYIQSAAAGTGKVLVF